LELRRRCDHFSGGKRLGAQAGTHILVRLRQFRRRGEALGGRPNSETALPVRRRAADRAMDRHAGGRRSASAGLGRPVLLRARSSRVGVVKAVTEAVGALTESGGQCPQWTATAASRGGCRTGIEGGGHGEERVEARSYFDGGAVCRARRRWDEIGGFEWRSNARGSGIGDCVSLPRARPQTGDGHSLGGVSPVDAEHALACDPVGARGGLTPSRHMSRRLGSGFVCGAQRGATPAQGASRGPQPG
jgi:hypothetical protein